MTLTKTHVRKKIKDLFLEKMVDQGFQLMRKGLGGARIKGDFVEVIAIQVGRNPGSLYLHYFMNLLSDPTADTLETYCVGTRLQQHPETGVIWMAETDNELEAVLNSIQDTVDKVALPFFKGINDYKDFTVEIVSDVNNRVFSFDLAICLAALYKYNKAFWLCDDDINMLNSNDDFDEDEKKEMGRYFKALKTVSQSHEKERVNNLLGTWKDSKLEILKKSIKPVNK